MQLQLELSLFFYNLFIEGIAQYRLSQAVSQAFFLHVFIFFKHEQDYPHPPSPYTSWQLVCS